MIGEPFDGEWLMCAPIDMPRVVKGSRTSECARCGGAVWIAPSGRDILREHPQTRVCCIPCAGVMQSENEQRGGVNVAIPLTDAQVVEAAAALRAGDL